LYGDIRIQDKRIRTINLIERAFEEQQRTKSIPRIWDEKNCLKLEFATLTRLIEVGDVCLQNTSQMAFAQ